MASTPKLSSSSQDIDRTVSSSSVTEGQNTSAADSLNKICGDLKLGTGISPEDIALATRDKDAVEFVFDYAKRWCKFIKELTMCLEKRGSLENDYVRTVGKQFTALQNTVSSMVGVPLKSEIGVMSQRFVENFKEIESNNNKRFQSVIDSLNRQRAQFERIRVQRKQEWKVELKKFLDAESAMYNARKTYIQRCQAGVKLREELEAAELSLNEFSNSMEAAAFAAAVTAASSSMSASSTSTNSSSTTPANSAAQVNQLGKLKAKVEKLEKSLTDNDKKELEGMNAYRDAVATANNQSQSLEKTRIQIICDIRLTTTTNDEVVRNVIADYVRQYSSVRQTTHEMFHEVALSVAEYQPCSAFHAYLSDHVKSLSEIPPERFTFEPFHDGVSATSQFKADSSVTRVISNQRSPFAGGTSDLSPNEYSGGVRTSGICQSDSEDDIDGLPECKDIATRSTMLSQIFGFGSNIFRPGDSKKMSVKKTRSTTEMPNLNDIFTTEKELALAYVVISRCVNEIESQKTGLSTNGIYRVPASKLKVSMVMEALNNSPQEVDISEEHPLTLASVLKNKLIALPEPLLTYNLYQTLVDFGKEVETGALSSEEIVKRLRSLISELPTSNRIITGLLFHHLRKISEHQSENQMGSTNLGTLFGPTLMRPKTKLRMANVMEFVDNKSQTKVVELLIDKVFEVFGGTEEYYNNTFFQNLSLSEVSSAMMGGPEVSSPMSFDTQTTTPSATPISNVQNHSLSASGALYCSGLSESSINVAEKYHSPAAGLNSRGQALVTTINYATAVEIPSLDLTTIDKSSVVKAVGEDVTVTSAVESVESTTATALKEEPIFHHPIATRPVTFNPGKPMMLTRTPGSTVPNSISAISSASPLSALSREPYSFSSNNPSSETEPLRRFHSNQSSHSKETTGSSNVTSRLAPKLADAKLHESPSIGRIDLEQIHFMDNEEIEDGSSTDNGNRSFRSHATSSSTVSSSSQLRMSKAVVESSPAQSQNYSASAAWRFLKKLDPTFLKKKGKDKHVIFPYSNGFQESSLLRAWDPTLPSPESISSHSSSPVFQRNHLFHPLPDSSSSVDVNNYFAIEKCNAAPNFHPTFSTDSLHDLCNSIAEETAREEFTCFSNFLHCQSTLSPVTTFTRIPSATVSLSNVSPYSVSSEAPKRKLFNSSSLKRTLFSKPLKKLSVSKPSLAGEESSFTRNFPFIINDRPSSSSCTPKRSSLSHSSSPSGSFDASVSLQARKVQSFQFSTLNDESTSPPTYF